MKFLVAPVARTAALAALACGAAFAAQAQSSVQVYGLIDMSVGSFDNAGSGTAATDKVTRVESGKMTTSFFALKGTEDLGGGLKAIFNLESFIAADSGGVIPNGNSFWDRQANVGLSGGFGSVFLGRNTNALFVQGLSFNPFGSSMGFSPTMRHLFSTAGNGGVAAFGNVLGGTAWSNSVIYSTPSFGGLSGSVQAAASEGAGDSSYAASARYATGALAAGLVVQKYRIGAADQDTWLASASYDLGVAKLFGQYGNVEDNAVVHEDKIFQVGASVPLGGGAVLASYGQLKRDATATPDFSDKVLTLGYDYNLSKRTDVYAVLVNHKQTSQSTGNSYALGVRHRF